MSRRVRTRAPRILAGLSLALVAALGIAAPAAAHDELIESDPAADAQMDAAPAEITLTFSAEILNEEGATEISVTDGAGTEVQDGDPVVDGTVVTQAVAEDAAPGDFVVLWKVVSSDGHPISGEIDFTVIAPTPSPSPTASPTTEPTEEPTASPTPTVTVTAEPVADEGGSDIWPWLIGGALGLAVAAAVVYLLATRARDARKEQELSSGNGNSAPGNGDPADQ